MVSKITSTILLLLLLSTLLTPLTITAQGEEPAKLVKTLTINGMKASLIELKITALPIFNYAGPVSMTRYDNTVAIAWFTCSSVTECYIRMYLTLIRFYDIDGDGRYDTFIDETIPIGEATDYEVQELSSFGIVKGERNLLVYLLAPTAVRYAGYYEAEFPVFRFAVLGFNGEIEYGVNELTPGINFGYARALYVPWYNVNNLSDGYLVVLYSEERVDFVYIGKHVDSGAWNTVTIPKVFTTNGSSIEYVGATAGKSKILLNVAVSGQGTKLLLVNTSGIVGEINVGDAWIEYVEYVSTNNSGYFIVFACVEDEYTMTITIKYLVIDENTGDIVSSGVLQEKVLTFWGVVSGKHENSFLLLYDTYFVEFYDSHFVEYYDVHLAKYLLTQSHNLTLVSKIEIPLGEDENLCLHQALDGTVMIWYVDVESGVVGLRIINDNGSDLDIIYDSILFDETFLPNDIEIDICGIMSLSRDASVIYHGRHLVTVLVGDLPDPLLTLSRPWLPDPLASKITLTKLPIGVFTTIDGHLARIDVDVSSNTIAIAWVRSEKNESIFTHHIYLTLARFYDADGDGRLDTYNTITRYLGKVYSECDPANIGVATGNGIVLVYWLDGEPHCYDIAVVDVNGTILLYEHPEPGICAFNGTLKHVHYVPWVNNGSGGFLFVINDGYSVRYGLAYPDATSGVWRFNEDWSSSVWSVYTHNQTIEHIITAVGEEKILLIIFYRNISEPQLYAEVVFTDDKKVVGRPNITISSDLFYHARHVNIGNNSYFVLLGYGPSSGEFVILVIDEHTGEVVLSKTLDLGTAYAYDVFGGKDGLIVLVDNYVGDYKHVIIAIKLSLDGEQLYEAIVCESCEGVYMFPHRFPVRVHHYVVETSGVFMIPYIECENGICTLEGGRSNIGVVVVKDTGVGFEVANSTILFAGDLPERVFSKYGVPAYFYWGALSIDAFAVYVGYILDDSQYPEVTVYSLILIGLGDTIDTVPVAEVMVSGEVVLPVLVPPKFIVIGGVPYISVTNIYEFYACDVCWFFDQDSNAVIIKVGNVSAPVYVKFSDVVNRSSELLIPAETVLRNVRFLIDVIVNEVWDLFDDGVWFWGLRVPGYTTTPLDFGVDVDGGNTTITSITDDSINMVVYPEQNNTTLKLYGVEPESITVDGEEIIRVDDLSQLNAYDKAWYYDEKTSTVYIYYSNATPGNPITLNVYLQPLLVEDTQQTQPIVLVPFSEIEGDEEETKLEVITIEPGEARKVLDAVLVILVAIALALLVLYSIILLYLRRRS